MTDAWTILEGRAVIALTGPDARDLLQRLVTNSVEALGPGQARYAALLSPQGKIVTDFLVVGHPDDGFLLDTPAITAADLVKKLTQYRLRAKVAIADRSSEFDVLAFTGTPPEGAVHVYPDPRSPALWSRAIVPRGAFSTGEGAVAYESARIEAAVPEGGRDFAYGDTFPQDANLDHLNGVDFTKGCYVGQEVVSRVHHRGTARKRIVKARFDGPSPPAGTEIVTGTLSIGTMGSAGNGIGLATVRLDRLAETTEPVMAGAVVLHLEPPAWA